MLEQLAFLSIKDIIIALIDVAIVAYVVYRGIILIRGTRAVQLIKGIVVLVIATTVSDWLNLVTFNWLLRNVEVMLLIALPIVFQPELRRALEQLGRGKLIAGGLFAFGEEGVDELVKEVVGAVEALSKEKYGALIVLERETGLSDIIESGTKIEGLVSAGLLVNIFMPRSPLHDGAVIIRGNRLMAAGCFLPLTDASYVTQGLGSRHRAAMGITEESDALAVVVSEETGAISLANGGKLIRNVDGKTLGEMLRAILRPRKPSSFGLWQRGSG